ncbi:DEAD/DEAH box helicase [Corynebacterium kutscheri]|uniref:DEAD/DEAH box helicase n=1 Tax=Corynebacterium kutscheri TaxID=35755 RepID=UPI0037C15A0C
MPTKDAKKALPTFRELGVAIEICQALAEQGIHRTFAIQELTLPIALAGRDLIGQARTGMGKTFGFGVPLLDRVFDDAAIAELDGSPRALIVVPTRELAQQVGEDLTTAAQHTPVKVTTIYGGTRFDDQLTALEKGTDVVVGTPGRLLDLYKRKALLLDQVAILVLDEADEMLDLGFLPDIERLLEALTHEHQTMLFSATMPGPILTLARAFMQHPVHIRAENIGDSQTNADIEQIVFQAHRMDKTAVTARILQAHKRGKTIIFTRTKRSAAELATDLGTRGFSVAALHGDMDQKARERSLTAFKKSAVDIVVATDVAARGIDIDDVTHVINYQTPDDPLTYVHRIGRTGRAGNKGVAVTLVGYDELNKWGLINDEHNLEIPVPPQWFSTSPELFEALDIPHDAGESIGAEKPALGGARGFGAKKDNAPRRSQDSRENSPHNSRKGRRPRRS